MIFPYSVLKTIQVGLPEIPQGISESRYTKMKELKQKLTLSKVKGMHSVMFCHSIM